MENLLRGIRVSKKKSLNQEVYESLRKSILHGKLKGGQHLIEEALSHQIGISRTPIREAFSKLERDDLVVFFRNILTNFLLTAKCRDHSGRSCVGGGCGDVGRGINPMISEGRVYGGATMGMGYASTERLMAAPAIATSIYDVIGVIQKIFL